MAESDARRTMLMDLYRSFNARDIDEVLSHLAPGVDWPNGGDWASEAGASLLYQPGIPDPTGFIRLNFAFPLGPDRENSRFTLSYSRALDLVKAYLKAQPLQANARGPHGIPLIAHAQMGAKNGVKEAAEVVEFLQALGNNSHPASCATS